MHVRSLTRASTGQGAAWRASLGVLLLGLALAACGDGLRGPSVPGGEYRGSVVGSVSLAGNEGGYPAGRTVSLYSSLANYEKRIAAYEVALRRTSPNERMYEFVFPSVLEGEYFLIACFEFGCGDWRDQTSGELLLVTVRAGSITGVHFRL